MSDSLLMPDACFAILAISGRWLNTWIQLVDFLKPWYGIAKYADNILLCLYKNSSLPPDLDLDLDISLDLSSKAQRKATLKAHRTFKKLKYMDDPKVAEAVCLTIWRNKWLVVRRKPMPETKTRMKKIAEAAKKKAEKEDKIGEKVKEKSQTMDIRILAISNSQRIVRIWKKIVLDLSIGFEAMTAISDLLDLTILDILRLEHTNSILKGFLGINARLNNS